jgi:phage protein D/phage baseplate assembly protein gpV
MATPVKDRIQFPDIKLEGTALTAVQYGALEALRVERSLWMPSRCTVRFQDHDFSITDAGTFAIGKTLKVGLPDIGGTVTAVFDGEITDIAIEQGIDRHHQLVVGALDKGHRLAATTMLRSFAKQKYSEIASTIAGDAGLSTDITATTAQIDYVVQTTNDYAFLWEIARRIGYDWWVDAGKLCFKPSPSTAGPTLKFGDTLADFRVRYSGALKGSKVTVQGWNPDTQQQVKGDDASTLTGTSIPAIGSDAPLATEGRSKAKSGWGKEYKTAAFIATTTTEAQSVAKALALEADATEVFARGTATSTPKLVPGKTVKIENMGTKVSGSYYVTTVEHTWGDDDPGVTTRFTAGNKQPVGLADLVGAGASGAPPWGAAGLVTGVVTNIQDPDKLGRVKVKFPALSTADESAWARVVSLGAGAERGIEILPEVNDEVIVGFEQGDLRYPVVLGGVWSKKNKPPIAETADKVKMRTIKSRLGHVIEISDGDDDAKKSVTIKLADGATQLVLAHDKVELIANSKPLSIKSGQASIAFDANGGITIKGQKVTIEAQTDLAAKGTNVKINGNANVEIAANAQFKASGNAGANLESSAVAIVKGSLVKIN